MKHLLIAIACAACLMDDARAETWIQVKGFPIAFDGDSIVREGDEVQYWLKTTAPGEVASLWPRKMNCKLRQDEAVGHFWLDKDGGRRDTGYHHSFERIAPGSDLEQLHSQLCYPSWQFWKKWL